MTGSCTRCEEFQDNLVSLAVESWRLSRHFSRALQDLDAGLAGRHLNRVRFFERSLSTLLGKAGIQLANLEGQPFEPGTAVTALTLEDYPGSQPLVIDQMIEPVVLGTTGVLRPGTATVKES